MTVRTLGEMREREKKEEMRKWQGRQQTEEACRNVERIGSWDRQTEEEEEDYEEMWEYEKRGVGKSNKNRREDRRGGAVKRKRSSTQAAEPSELYEFLKSPIPRDDPDEIFALSLASELKKIKTNKGQLKVQLLSMIVTWESQQNLHLTTPSYVHSVSNTLQPNPAPYYYHPQSPNNSYHD